jgi:DNA mismatch repair ATPase MutS
VIIINEGFSSTTYEDALFLGERMLARVRERGSIAVYVTFIDELASFGEAIVSMVAEVDEHDSTRRTYRILRGAPAGTAYAAAVAARGGLAYEQLKERLER